MLVGKKIINFPYPIDESLFVGHYLVAEVNCMLQLQLQKPKNLWDTWVENKKLYNGKIKKGYGLVDCLSRYGIEYPLDKDKWRDVILGKKDDRDKMFLPKYSKADQEGILDYCFTDVTTNEQLFCSPQLSVSVLFQDLLNHHKICFDRSRSNPPIVKLYILAEAITFNLGSLIFPPVLDVSFCSFALHIFSNIFSSMFPRCRKFKVIFFTFRCPKSLSHKVYNYYLCEVL